MRFIIATILAVFLLCACGAPPAYPDMPQVNSEEQIPENPQNEENQLPSEEDSELEDSETPVDPEDQGTPEEVFENQTTRSMVYGQFDDDFKIADLFGGADKLVVMFSKTECRSCRDQSKKIEENENMQESLDSKSCQFASIVYKERIFEGDPVSTWKRRYPGFVGPRSFKTKSKRNFFIPVENFPLTLVIDRSGRVERRTDVAEALIKDCL